MHKYGEFTKLSKKQYKCNNYCSYLPVQFVAKILELGKQIALKFSTALVQDSLGPLEIPAKNSIARIRPQHRKIIILGVKCRPALKGKLKEVSVKLPFYGNVSQVSTGSLIEREGKKKGRQIEKQQHLETRKNANKATVQIVRSDRTMEQIVFPVPSICEFLTKESKLRIYYTTERDEQGSKINDFFMKSEDLFNEMNWQKKLRGRLLLPACLCGA